MKKRFSLITAAVFSICLVTFFSAGEIISKVQFADAKIIVIPPVIKAPGRQSKPVTPTRQRNMSFDNIADAKIIVIPPVIKAPGRQSKPVTPTRQRNMSFDNIADAKIVVIAPSIRQTGKKTKTIVPAKRTAAVVNEAIA